MTLPQTLDAGDCITFDRDLALQATSHILIAMKLLLEVSPSGISSIWIWLISTSAKCLAEVTGARSLMSW